jgi:hypothetical protein
MFSKILMYYSIIYLIHSLIKKNLKKYRREKNRENKLNLSIDKKLFSKVNMKEDIDINQDINQDINENINQDINEDLYQDINENINQDINKDLYQDINENLYQDINKDLYQDINEDLYQDINEDINQDINCKSSIFSKINNEKDILYKKNVDINDLYKNLFNKNKNIQKNNNNKNSNCNDETSLVLYRENIHKKYNANEGLSLCFKENTEKNHNSDKDLSLFLEEQSFSENTENNINEFILLEQKNKKSIKEISIFKKCISNYIIPENDFSNKLVFNFEAKNNNYYKIICKMILNNINNVILKISNNNKEFIYNIEESLKINEFSFVLDNNQFNNDNISIHLYFYNNYEQIEINDFYIEVIEKPILKATDPIIILNINDNYKPIYIDVCNILDFIDCNNVNDYNNMNDYPFSI